MKEVLKQAIKDSLIKCGINEEIDILIEIPKDLKNGDYSSNVAMQLTRILKKNPKDIANEIKENINNDNILNVYIYQILTYGEI